jgi:hypothetical protein
VTSNELNAILGTAAKLLAAKQQLMPLSILVNSKPSLSHWSHDNWNGGQDEWRLDLALPPEVYLAVECREEIEKAINDVLGVVLAGISEHDSVFCRLQTSIERDPDWRRKARQVVSGGGITNQGRVRTDNIAARQHEGLLFRSRQEEFFYDALKRQAVPFAPLAVLLKGGYEYRRAEPDFMIFKDGISMIVEIDGDLYHSETPAAAHHRLKFLTDEGVRLERINASACDTPEKAREAVGQVIRTMDKLKASS